jgi:hypothetical protein
LQPSFVTTKDERSYGRQEPKSSECGRGFYEDAFSTSKQSVPFQHHNIGEAPKVSNFIFKETAPKWKDAGDRRSDSGKR